jgi:hypothetical protein
MKYLSINQRAFATEVRIPTSLRDEKSSLTVPQKASRNGGGTIWTGGERYRSGSVAAVPTIGGYLLVMQCVRRRSLYVLTCSPFLTTSTRVALRSLGENFHFLNNMYDIGFTSNRAGCVPFAA